MDTENKISEKTLIIAVLTIVVSDYLLALLLGYLPITDNPKVAIIRLVQLGALIGILFLFNKGVSAIGLSKATAFNGLKKGMIWSIAFGGIAGASFVILFISGVNPFDMFHIDKPNTIMDITIYFIVGGIIGPIVEEVFFRGFLYGFFREWGVAFGIVVSTAIFAVLHMKGGGVPYIQMAGGLVFAVSYELEKSLVVPIVIHVTGNIALFTISLV